jgi:DNA-binding Lrp family transcriptional regulator
MIFVYILGILEAGTENDTFNSLKNINQVRKASLTYGTYDLCIEALFKHLEELDDFVYNVLRKIPGIKETVTLVTSRSVTSKPDQAISFG